MSTNEFPRDLHGETVVVSGPVRTRYETLLVYALLVCVIAMAFFCVTIVNRRSSTVEHIDCYEKYKVTYNIALGDLVLDGTDADRKISPESIAKLQEATENYRQIAVLCPTTP